MLANMVGMFGRKTEQYECVTKFGLVNQDDERTLQQYQKNGGLFASNKKKQVLYQMLLDAAENAGKQR